MDSENGQEVCDLSIYTNMNILHGEIRCPTGLRLSDLFNRLGISRGKGNDFFEFINVFDPNVRNVDCEKRCSFIRKDSIQILAVSSVNTGRGIGANSDYKYYPFVPKTKVSITLQLQDYHLAGSINLAEGQTTKSLLHEDKQFLPMTEVTIGSEKGLADSWPFAMVNKNSLSWLRENWIDLLQAANN
jgi:hypothetical protein